MLVGCLHINVGEPTSLGDSFDALEVARKYVEQNESRRKQNFEALLPSWWHPHPQLHSHSHSHSHFHAMPAGFEPASAVPVSARSAEERKTYACDACKEVKDSAAALMEGRCGRCRDSKVLERGKFNIIIPKNACVCCLIACAYPCCHFPSLFRIGGLLC